MPVPYLGISGDRNSATKAAHLYGITPIDVFNMTDLKMAENWFTLESIDFNELTPILNSKGERLLFHRSDKIYFGNTLVFRRSTIGSETCSRANMEMYIDYLSKVYLNQKNSSDGDYTFHYKQYYQQLPDTKNLEMGIYKINEPTLRCEQKFRVNYQS